MPVVRAHSSQQQTRKGRLQRASERETTPKKSKTKKSNKISESGWRVRQTKTVYIRIIVINSVVFESIKVRAICLGPDSIKWIDVCFQQGFCVWCDAVLLNVRGCNNAAPLDRDRLCKSSKRQQTARVCVSVFARSPRISRPELHKKKTCFRHDNSKINANDSVC